MELINMNLTSLIFLIFCTITIIIYFIIPKKVQWLILLISSVIFLFYQNFNLFTIIQALVVLFSAYYFGIIIYRYQSNKKAKKYLIIGILIILRSEGVV